VGGALKILLFVVSCVTANMSITDLPIETLMGLLSFLPVADVLRCRLVCHDWQEGIDGLDGDSIWKILCMRDFGFRPGTKVEATWFETYRAFSGKSASASFWGE